MRIAFFADIHANREAFEACLQDAARRGEPLLPYRCAQWEPPVPIACAQCVKPQRTWTVWGVAAAGGAAGHQGAAARH